MANPYSQVFVYTEDVNHYSSSDQNDQNSSLVTIKFMVTRRYHSRSNHSNSIEDYSTTHEFTHSFDKFESMNSSCSLFSTMVSSIEPPFQMENLYWNNPNLGNMEDESRMMRVSYSTMVWMMADAATRMMKASSGRELKVWIENRIMISEFKRNRMIKESEELKCNKSIKDNEEKRKCIMMSETWLKLSEGLSADMLRLPL
ncbi:hypothetical protein CsatB_019209 [Cannabis sativa]